MAQVILILGLSVIIAVVILTKMVLNHKNKGNKNEKN